jgi:16S rRNA (guanine966-N2)-methyltransferase
MRIVAGLAGGIPLATPPGDLRPTMDKVRGAIFSRLADWLPGQRVVDLFAGSGSLGLEALSRGAASVIWVEKNAAAVRSITDNLRRSKLPGTAAARQEDVFYFLDHAPGEAFDLILADPPYHKRPEDRDFADELLRHPGLTRILAPGGLLVLEVYRLWDPPTLRPWSLTKAKTYGESKVCYFERAEPATT